MNKQEHLDDSNDQNSLNKESAGVFWGFAVIWYILRTTRCIKHSESAGPLRRFAVMWLHLSITLKACQ